MVVWSVGCHWLISAVNVNIRDTGALSSIKRGLSVTALTINLSGEYSAPRECTALFSYVVYKCQEISASVSDFNYYCIYFKKIFSQELFFIIATILFFKELLFCCGCRSCFIFLIGHETPQKVRTERLDDQGCVCINPLKPIHF